MQTARASDYCDVCHGVGVEGFIRTLRRGLGQCAVLTDELPGCAIRVGPELLDKRTEEAEDCFVSLSGSYYLILSCGDAPPQPDSRRGWGWGRSRAPPQFHPLCHSPTPGHHQQHKPKPSRQPLGYRLVGPEPQHGVSVGGFRWGPRWVVAACRMGKCTHFCPGLLSLLMPLLCSCRSTMVGLSSGLSPALMSNNPLATIQGACCLVSPHCHQPRPLLGLEPPHRCPSHATLPCSPHCLSLHPHLSLGKV